MLIDIKEDGSNLVSIINEKNGRKNEKIITMDDFITSIVSSNSLGDFDPVASPLYRKVSGTKLIQAKQYSKNSTIYILHSEKHQAPMQIFSRFYGDVGYPHLLFAVKVVNKVTTNLCVVAIKDNDVKEQTKIYHYPYTNVSGSLGNVCLGGNKFEKGIEGDKLYKIPFQFMSMPNTLHSYSPKKNTKLYEFEEMIKILQGKEFDESLLVPNKELPAYKDWFEALGR